MRSKENLLFGIFAWRLGFIDRDQLTKAIQVDFKAETPDIAGAMIELGFFDDATRNRIQDLLDEQIARHAGDQEKSLASLGCDQETLDSLRDGTDPTPVEKPNSPIDTESCSTSLMPIHIPIERGEFYARGGLGRICRSTDTSLMREVAVKEINEKYADLPEARRRFRREARVTSHLQHPGIVPVYGLGADDAGRPYYTMRLIDGVELREKIGAMHRTTFDFQSLEFLSLLDCVIDVAQTIRYAHSKQVLHRDLKPANILVGKFGETVVIDWGLAKLMGESDTSSSLDVSDADGDADTTDTQQGQILGTPGYAAPEQVSGDQASVDVRTDVYGLGAVLYQLLTGQAPIRPQPGSDDSIEVGRRNDQIALPNELKRPIPTGLAAVAMKALRTDPSERYESAEQFVEDINRWKADLPVSATRETLSQRLARLGRKYQKLILGTAASLLVVTVVSGFSLYFLNKARIAEFKQRQTAAKLAEEKSDLAFEKTSLAALNKKIADRFVGAFENSNPKIPGVTNETTALEILEKFNQQTLVSQSNEAPLTTAALLKAAGNSMFGLGAFDESLAAFEKAEAIFVNELGDDDEETLSVRYNMASCLNSLGKYEQAYEILEPIVHKSEESEVSLNILLPRKTALAASINFLGRHKEAKELYEEILEQYEVWDLNAVGYWESTLGLATALERLGDYPKAVELFERTHRKLKEELGEGAPSSLSAMRSLAMGYNRLRRTKDAIVLGERSVLLHREKYGIEHEGTLVAMGALADAYERDKQIDLAIETYIGVLEVGQPYLGATHPHTLAWQSNLADAYRAKGEKANASRIFKKVYEAKVKRFGSEHSSTLLSMNNYGSSLSWIGETKESIRVLRQTLAGRIKVIGPEHPMTLSTMDGLSKSLKADTQYAESLEVAEELVRLCRKIYGDENDITLTREGSLANRYRLNGRNNEAVNVYKHHLSILDEKYSPKHSYVVKVRVAWVETLLAVQEFGQVDVQASVVINVLSESGKDAVSLNRARLACAESKVNSNDMAAAATFLQEVLSADGLPPELRLRAEHLSAYVSIATTNERADLVALEESVEALDELLGHLTPIKRLFVERAMENAIAACKMAGDGLAADKWTQRLVRFHSDLNVEH